MGQSVLGCLRQMVLSKISLLASQQLLVLFDVCFDLSELVEKLIVHLDLQILDVIVGLVGALELLLWLTRIHSLEDADPSEILESELQLPDRFGAGQVLGLLSLLPLLYLFCHIEYFYFCVILNIQLIAKSIKSLTSHKNLFTLKP